MQKCRPMSSDTQGLHLPALAQCCILGLKTAGLWETSPLFSDPAILFLYYYTRSIMPFCRHDSIHACRCLSHIYICAGGRWAQPHSSRLVIRTSASAQPACDDCSGYWLGTSSPRVSANFEPIHTVHTHTLTRRPYRTSSATTPLPKLGKLNRSPSRKSLQVPSVDCANR